MHSKFFFMLASAAFSVALPEMTRFNKRTEPPPSNGTLFPGNCAWDYQGCYNEPATGRILPAYRVGDDALTVEKCFAYCLAAPGGYTYALVEFGRECWCDKTPVLTGGTWNGTGTGCRLACAGNKTELCGGDLKGLLYHLNPSASTCTSTSTSTSSTTSTTSTTTITTCVPATTTITSQVTETATTTATTTETTPTVSVVTATWTLTDTSTTTDTLTDTSTITNTETVSTTLTQPTTVTELTTVTASVIIPTTLTQSFTATVTETSTTTTALETVTSGSVTFTVSETVTAPITQSVTATVTVSYNVPVTISISTTITIPKTVSTTVTAPGTVTIYKTSTVPTTTTVPVTVTIPTTIRTTASVCTTSTTKTKCTLPSVTVGNGGFENCYDDSWALSKGGQQIDANYANGGHSGSSCYHFQFSKNSLLDTFLTLKQDLKGCLGTNYILNAWTKRPLSATGCTADFYIGEQIVASSNNGGSSNWVATQSKGTFQADDSGKIALSIKTTCPGSRSGDFSEFFLDDVSISTVN